MAVPRLTPAQLLAEYNRTVTRICARTFQPVGVDSTLDADRVTLAALCRELRDRDTPEGVV